MPNSKDIRTATETQEGIAWRPPGGTLGELAADAEARSAELRTGRAEPGGRADNRGRPSLVQALRRTDVALIAEIKRASPSRGPIKPGLDPVAQAESYQRGGAAAISVLTEPKRFGGSNEDLRAVARATRLPILRKDFHVDPLQLHEAQHLGASAALLIARALPPARFRELVATGQQIGLEILAEVHTMQELDLALDAGCRLIGVNNRNLETLEIEPHTAEQIIPRIPSECIAVAESGYSDRESVTSAARAGADAVLIGSFLSASDDPANALRGLTGVQRVSRGK